MGNSISEICTLDLIDNSLYCLCNNYNCIISISLDDFNVEYAGKLEREYTFQICLSGCSSVLGNEILYCPYRARNIHFFNVETGEDSIIAGSACNDIGSGIYWGFLQDGDIYYAIPMYGENILKIDSKERKVTEVIDISNRLRGKGLDCHIKDFAECDGYQYKDKFYISLRKDPYIAELDFKNGSYQAYRLEGVGTGSCGVAGIGELLYVYSKGQYIVVYNIDEKTVINKVKIPIKENIFLYITLVVNQEIYFYQIDCQIAVKYNAMTNDIAVFNFSEKLAGLADKDAYKPIGKIGNSKIVLLSNMENMAILDLENDTYKCYGLKCDVDGIRKKIVENLYFPDNYVYECTDLALPSYAVYSASNKAGAADGRVGLKIYSSVSGCTG